MPERVAVLGCGAWGKNLVRNFHALGALAAVCDSSAEGRSTARAIAPDTPVHDAADRVLEDRSVQGVVIATPAASHAEVARRALEAGKDVFCEKPLALAHDDARELAHLAAARARILMVGHILEYHPAIVKLRELVASGELGDLRYFYSHRLNLGRVRRAENVLWSFAPHDIAVAIRLAGGLPVQVVAGGGSYLSPDVHDVVVLQLLFETGAAGHIFVSWLNPLKEQRLAVIGSERTATFDDVAKELTLHDHRIDLARGEPMAIRGPSRPIAYAQEEEPLRKECEAFLESMRTREPPLAGAESALAVLRVLEAAQSSLLLQGAPVRLEREPATAESP